VASGAAATREAVLGDGSAKGVRWAQGSLGFGVCICQAEEPDGSGRGLPRFSFYPRVRLSVREGMHFRAGTVSCGVAHECHLALGGGVFSRSAYLTLREADPWERWTMRGMVECMGVLASP
jgi:hypothetical protein